MAVSRRSHVFAAAVLGAVLVLDAPAGATDTRDQAVLDAVVRDLGISLLDKPENTLLRLPLAPGRWSFFGRMQPYASLGPRVSTQAEEPTGLALPLRETDELSKGLGVGAGLNWRLTDRLELFGEYQLLNMGKPTIQPDSALGRRDVETPGLKGGFSIRF
jgi:hypothetical protein